MLEAIKRAPHYVDLPDDSHDKIARAAVYVWSHLQKCALERGLKYCEAVGTESDMPVFLRKQEQPRDEDPQLYRYLVPGDVPGSRFILSFLQPGIGE